MWKILANAVLEKKDKWDFSEKNFLIIMKRNRRLCMVQEEKGAGGI